MKNKFLVVFVIIALLVPCTPKPTPTSPTTNPSYIPGTSDKKVLLDFALSPDGTQVAIYTNQDVYIYDFETHNKNVIEKFDNNDFAYGGAGAVAFSPDGKKIAISGKFPDQPINIWEIDSHALTEWIINIPNGYFVGDIEFSPDGNRLVVINTYQFAAQCQGPENKLVLYDISTSDNWRDSDLYSIDGCSEAPIVFRFTRNDRLYVYLYPDLHIVDTVTGQIDEIEQDSHFQDISANGELMTTYDLQDKNYIVWKVGEEKLKLVELQNTVVLLNNGEHFLEHHYNQNMNYWANGQVKCEYGEIELFNFKVSRNGAVFGTIPSTKSELQLWSIPNCELIETLVFDG